MLPWPWSSIRCAELVDARHRALDVDGQDVVDRLLGDVAPRHLLARHVADVVDQRRRPRRASSNACVGHRRDLRPLDDVGLQQHGLGAGSRARARRCASAPGRRAAVVDADGAGALLRGPDGDLGAEAGAGSGDDDGAALEATRDRDRGEGGSRSPTLSPPRVVGKAAVVMLAIGSPDDPADNPRVTDLTRYADFLAFLDEQHAADPDLRAAWVGGSAATGGYDEWSDLDVEVLCTPGTYVDVYRRPARGDPRAVRAADVWAAPGLDVRRRAPVLRRPSTRRPGALAAPTRLVDFVVLGDDRRAPPRRRTPARLAPRPLRPATGWSSSATTTRRLRRRAIAESVDQVRRSDWSASGW